VTRIKAHQELKNTIGGLEVWATHSEELGEQALDTLNKAFTGDEGLYLTASEYRELLAAHEELTHAKTRITAIRRHLSKINAHRYRYG